MTIGINTRRPEQDDCHFADDILCRNVSNSFCRRKCILIQISLKFASTGQIDKRNRYYNDVIMGAIAPQITSLTIVYSTVYSDADQRKHQSSASLAFVRGIHRRPVNSPHKWPVTPKMFPFDDVSMSIGSGNGLAASHHLNQW